MPPRLLPAILAVSACLMKRGDAEPPLSCLHRQTMHEEALKSLLVSFGLMDQSEVRRQAVG